jgi:hypothetical protein
MKVDSNFLKHYGILGMKWGRRKGSSDSSSPKKPGSPDHQRKQSLKGKRIKDMSNEEIRDFTTRLQLESSYKKANIKPKSASRKIVEGIVGEISKKILKEVVNQATSKLLGASIKTPGKITKAASAAVKKSNPIGFGR